MGTVHKDKVHKMSSLGSMQMLEPGNGGLSSGTPSPRDSFVPALCLFLWGFWVARQAGGWAEEEPCSLSWVCTPSWT